MTAFLAARFCVCVFARIESRWRRRTAFWILWSPVCLAVSLFLFSFVADDLTFLRTPSYVVGLSAPLLVFNVTLLISALAGFRADKETRMPRAHSWNGPRIGKRCLAVATLLIVAIFLFDLQLRHQLAELKDETLADWTARPTATIENKDNAALVFLELEDSRDVLSRWDTSLEDVSLRELNPEDALLTGLHECEPAFEAIRRAAKKTAWDLPGDASQHPLMDDDEEARLFHTAVRLFAYDLVVRTELGDTAGTGNDLLCLRKAAAHLASEPTSIGLLCAGQAWSMTTSTFERLLQSRSALSDDVLRSLIDEQYNPRLVLPEALTGAKTAFTSLMCDLYLGELNDQQLEELGLQSISELPATLRVFGGFLDRITTARDDLSALQWRTQVFDSFATRLTDPQATTDELHDQFRMRIPRGTTLTADSRDMLFYSVVAVNDAQQLMNLMAAATLFRREHGRFPKDTVELTPNYLTEMPRSLRDGEPYRLRTVGDGLVIYSAEDARDIESEPATSGNIRRNSTRFLISTAFLGEEFKSMYGTEKPSESGSGPTREDTLPPAGTIEPEANLLPQ